MLEIKTTGMDEYVDHLRLVLAGPPGSGKQRVAAQAPNPVFLSVGRNLMSLADKGLTYIPIESSQRLANTNRK